MGLSRVIYAKFGDRLNLLNAQLLSGVLCVGGYPAAALSTVPLALCWAAACAGFPWHSVARHLQRGGPAPARRRHGHVRPAGPVWGPGLLRRSTLVGMVSGAAGGSLKTGLLFAVVFPVFLMGAVLVCKAVLARPAPKGGKTN